MGHAVASPLDLGPPTPVWVEPIAKGDLQPDHWYLGWRCAACGCIAAIQDDPTCGALLLRLSGRGVVCFRCHACRSVEVQTPAQCVQYHRAPGRGRKDRVVGQR